MIFDSCFQKLGSMTLVPEADLKQISTTCISLIAHFLMAIIAPLLLLERASSHFSRSLLINWAFAAQRNSFESTWLWILERKENVEHCPLDIKVYLLSEKAYTTMYELAKFPKLQSCNTAKGDIQGRFCGSTVTI